MSSQSIPDVVVIGGGPAGSVAARLLARAGVRVTLVAANDEPFRFGESLVPSARQLLAEIGAWERFEADAHLPCYGNASAWGSSELAYTDFIRSPYGHGWHLNRARFDATLRELAAEAGVDVLRGERFVRCVLEGGRWRIALTSREIAAGWLVDCAGRASPVSRALGIERAYDDRLAAVYARFAARDGDDDSTTLVESAPDGWWHTALLPNRERIVTFFTDSDLPAVRQFAELLPTTTHVQARIAGAPMTAPPRTTDARTSRLAQVAGEAWVAAGDAAVSFDPVSAQGILSAMYGAMKAADAILSGNVVAYEARIDELHARFLDQRAETYATEERWWEREFWSRRRFT